MDDGDADRLPVFLSVSEIEFPVTERSPRRVITIYNPYGYPIQYKVLCNAPTNYAVPYCKGILLAKSCKDLVVKCVTRLTVGTTDRLRVEIMEYLNAASSQLVCLGVAVICAVALMAPTQGDPAAANSLLPQHFHLTVPQKLVAAYILGIVSILLLRPMT
ncbi:hypothetical protein OSTOST_04147 [Ostertagia ostertagi]